MLLAIETATDTCAVALVDAEERVLAERATHEARAHAAELAPMIAAVFAETGVTPAGLAGVAVSAGPGSFTGLRIGVGTATGLALAWDVPVWPVPTLDALVLAVEIPPRARAVAVLPCRRGEVYVGGDGHPPRVVPLDRLDAALGCVDAVVALPGMPLSCPNAITESWPRAEAVARWALAHGAPVAPDAVEPLYVQAFEPLRRA